jgi:hypothetical protein
VSLIEAQAGTTQGGTLLLSAGGGPVAPGPLQLKTFAPGTVSGEIQFYASLSQYLGITHDTSTTRTSIAQIGAGLDFEASNLGLHTSGNIAFFSGPADFGGGNTIAFIRNSDTPPATPPSNGVFVWAEGGELKAMASSGNVTVLAPA